METLIRRLNYLVRAAEDGPGVLAWLKQVNDAFFAKENRRIEDLVKEAENQEAASVAVASEALWHRRLRRPSLDVTSTRGRPRSGRGEGGSPGGSPGSGPARGLNAAYALRESDQRAIALECKYQDTQGTTDEKIPYALDDLAALRMPGCLVYAGTGWSAGVLHTLQGAPLASYCLPDRATLARTPLTRELDHVLAMTFGFGSMVLPESRRFAP